METVDTIIQMKKEKEGKQEAKNKELKLEWKKKGPQIVLASYQVPF